VSQGIPASERLSSVFSLFYQLVNFVFEIVDEFPRLVHGRHERASLAFPSIQSVQLGVSSADLGHYLLAEATLCGIIFIGCVYEPHSTCFTSAVLPIALVGKVGPAVVSAGESLLVVETHFYQFSQL
jgi:hypothetical protein